MSSCATTHYSIRLLHECQQTSCFIFRPICEKCIEKAGQNGITISKLNVINPLKNTFPQSHQYHILHRNILRLNSTQNLQIFHFSTLNHIPRPLPSNGHRYRFFINGGLCVRSMSTSRILGGIGRFLKVRYLVLTSAIGGGVTLNKVGLFIQYT